VLIKKVLVAYFHAASIEDISGGVEILIAVHR
jgi:hypothetical protein